MEALDAIRGRRSISRLAEPGPTPDEVRLLLEAACCAPDHGELRPWRFVVLEGDAKDAFGRVLADAYVQRAAAVGAAPTEGQLTKERTKLGRAPLVIVVAAVHRPSEKVPFEEQVASASAAAQNLCLAATALGYGTMWRTGDVAYDVHVKDALGLDDRDAIIGFVYVGTVAPDQAKPANEPVLDGVVEHWTP